jgi:hypothetical protein
MDMMNKCILIENSKKFKLWQFRLRYLNEYICITIDENLEVGQMVKILKISLPKPFTKSIPPLKAASQMFLSLYRFTSFSIVILPGTMSIHIPIVFFKSPIR